MVLFISFLLCVAPCDVVWLLLYVLLSCCQQVFVRTKQPTCIGHTLPPTRSQAIVCTHRLYGRLHGWHVVCYARAFIIYARLGVRLGVRLSLGLCVCAGRDLIFSTWGASFGPGENCYLPCVLNYPHTKTKFTKHPLPNTQPQNAPKNQTTKPPNPPNHPNHPNPTLQNQAVNRF